MNRTREAVDAIVAAILTDLQCRRGFRQVWTDIDDDTRADITATWSDLVRIILAPPKSDPVEKLRGYFDDPEDRLDRQAAPESIAEQQLHSWLSGEGARCLLVKACGAAFEVQAAADGPPPSANNQNTTARWMARNVSSGLPAAIRCAQLQLDADLTMARRGRVP